MNSLATFHAYWWEHPRLGTDIGKLPNGETSIEQILRFPHSMRETEEMFPGFVDFLGDRLSTARRALYEGVFSSWPFSGLVERLNARQGITLIHGDAHAWNFLYPRRLERGRVCIIDWHEWEIGLGAHDLAQLILLWWYPERRARLEEPLLRRYHHQLVAHGVEGYDWEQFWNDYRLSAIGALLNPVWMYAERRPPNAWWAIMERVLLAFQDLDCVDLLE
jgi:thiamine kinase-like enzyme